MNKNLVLTLFIVMNIHTASFAAEALSKDNAAKVVEKNKYVKLPSADILAERLRIQFGLGDLIKKTAIQRLGGDNVSPEFIAQQVQGDLEYYSGSFNDPNMTAVIMGWKPLILKSFLSDFPEAIKGLEQKKLLESTIAITSSGEKKESNS